MKRWIRMAGVARNCFLCAVVGMASVAVGRQTGNVVAPEPSARAAAVAPDGGEAVNPAEATLPVVERVTLKPVFVPKPTPVSLRPVLIGEEPKPEAEPEPEPPSPKPEKERTAPKPKRDPAPETKTEAPTPPAQRIDPPKLEKKESAGETKSPEKRKETAKAGAARPEWRKPIQKDKASTPPAGMPMATPQAETPKATAKAGTPAPAPKEEMRKSAPVGERMPPPPAQAGAAEVKPVNPVNPANPDPGERRNQVVAQAGASPQPEAAGLGSSAGPPATGAVQRDPGASAMPTPEPTPLSPEDLLRATALLAQARQFLQSGATDQGREAALTIVRELPGSPEAPDAILLAAGAIDDLAQAVNELRDLVLRYPEATASRVALSRIGEFSLILGDYPGSVQAFMAYRLIETDPKLVREADIRIAQALLRAQNYPEARREYEQMLTKYPDQAEAPENLEGLADALLAIGETARAADIYQRIDARFPNYPYAVKILLSRGLCAELMGQPAAAMGHYRTITRDYAQSLEAELAKARLSDLRRPLIPGMPLPEN